MGVENVLHEITRIQFWGTMINFIFHLNVCTKMLDIPRIADQRNIIVKSITNAVSNKCSWKLESRDRIIALANINSFYRILTGVIELNILMINIRLCKEYFRYS